MSKGAKDSSKHLVKTCARDSGALELSNLMLCLLVEQPLIETGGCRQGDLVRGRPQSYLDSFITENGRKTMNLLMVYNSFRTIIIVYYHFGNLLWLVLLLHQFILELLGTQAFGGMLANWDGQFACWTHDNWNASLSMHVCLVFREVEVVRIDTPFVWFIGGFLSPISA